MIGPASHYSFAVAVSVLLFVTNEDWWRRGESNPRPEIFHSGVYILSPMFNFRPKVRNRARLPRD
jgi:hypothetical protein